MGGDLGGSSYLEFEVVSIRAPAWGATAHELTVTLVFEVSIRAPAWGATVNVSGKCIRKASFNPRPRMGGDREVGTHDPVVPVSIRAPAWGATGNA